MAGIQTMATTLTMKKKGSEGSDTVIAHITSIGEQSGESEEIDVTTLDSPNRAKEYIQGAKDSGTVEVTCNNCFDGQAEALYSVYKAGEVREFTEAYPDGKGSLAYSGFIQSFTWGEATPDGLATFNFAIRLSGEPVYTEK